MKFAILWTILVIACGLAGLAESQAVRCGYQEGQSYVFQLPNGITNAVPYYTCNLDTNNLLYGHTPTTIEGFHGWGKSDFDVKYLTSFKYHKLHSFSSIYCKEFRNLEAIFANEMKIEFVDEDSFQNCRNLKYLHLTNNNFRQVPANLFVNQHQLMNLDLRDNKITTLYSNSFDGLGNLEVLVLDRNEISELPQFVFAPLRNLKQLHLKSNKLATVHADSFVFLPKLWHIDLNDNYLTSLDEKIVDSTGVLQIDLRDNLCFNGVISNRCWIKPQITMCIAGYNPRAIFLPRPLPITHRQPAPQVVTQPPPRPKVVTQPSTQALTQAPPRPTQAPTQAPAPLTQKPPTKKPAQSCGRSPNAKGNIIGGSFINKGAYPWMATLVDPASSEYFCGGVLISKRKVLTVAHCMQNKGDAVARLARDFVVSLGIHNLNIHVDPDRKNYAVQTVNIHDDWNPSSERWDADIAVLYLDKDVTFTPFIQPICLIPADSTAEQVKKGFVVGYGKSEDTTKTTENIAKVLDMPIVDKGDCLTENPGWAKLASKRTFCAGRNDSQGVCNGDSGSGLYVNYGGVFYLRGIVSASLFDSSNNCDVDSYGLFTDVPKYNDWIRKVEGNPHLVSKK